MKIYRIICLLLLSTLRIHAADAAHIGMRMSFKYFATSVDNTFPAAIDASLAQANVVLDRQRRGLRMERTEVIRLDPSLPLPSFTFYEGPEGQPATTQRTITMHSWGQWWLGAQPVVFGSYTQGATSARIEVYETLRPLWKQAISDNPGAFGYSGTASNVYIIWAGLGGGEGTFPGDPLVNNNIFFVNRLEKGFLLHEWGHWTGLLHTFNSPIGSGLGDDGLADTPTASDGDLAEIAEPVASDPLGKKLFFDSVAQATFGKNLAELPANNVSSQRQEVRYMAAVANAKGFGMTEALSAEETLDIKLTFRNIMSYHSGGPDGLNLFSEQQLDIMTDNFRKSPQGRMGTTTGIWHYFGAGGASGPEGAGTSATPYRNITVANSNTNPAGGDILLARPGSYPGANIRLNKPCTIRATRLNSLDFGEARIGTGN